MAIATSIRKKIGHSSRHTVPSSRPPRMQPRRMQESAEGAGECGGSRDSHDTHVSRSIRHLRVNYFALTRAGNPGGAAPL